MNFNGNFFVFVGNDIYGMIKLQIRFSLFLFFKGNEIPFINLLTFFHRWLKLVVKKFFRVFLSLLENFLQVITVLFYRLFPRSNFFFHSFAWSGSSELSSPILMREISFGRIRLANNSIWILLLRRVWDW